MSSALAFSPWSQRKQRFPLRASNGRSIIHSDSINMNIAPAYDEKKLLRSTPTFDLRAGLPRREDPNKPALWIDRRCHRSMYSWQARVALAVALAEPQHRSVTFISYSCSGSEVLPGLLYPWEGREVIGSRRESCWNWCDAISGILRVPS